MFDEDDALELAKRLETELTGSILALWQQRLTQSSPGEEDIEIDYASESDVASTGPPSPTHSHSAMPLPSQADHATSHNKTIDSVCQDKNGNRRPAPVVSTNPLAPVRLPIMGDNSNSPSNAALSEIRARLRKTKFDYSNDSRQRISEATPKSADYRNVLKKKT